MKLTMKLLERREKERSQQWLEGLVEIFGRPERVESGSRAALVAREGLQRKSSSAVTIRADSFDDLVGALEGFVSGGLVLIGVDAGLPLAEYSAQAFFKGLAKFPFAFEDLIAVDDQG